MLWSVFDQLPDPLGFTWLAGELLVFGMTIIPYKPKLNGFRIWSDGLKMVTFLFGRDRDVIADAYARVASSLGSETPPDALAALLASGTLNRMEAEFARQLIHENVDAEQAEFRKNRRTRSEPRKRTWRRALASVRSTWRES